MFFTCIAAAAAPIAPKDRVAAVKGESKREAQSSSGQERQKDFVVQFARMHCSLAAIPGSRSLSLFSLTIHRCRRWIPRKEKEERREQE